MNTDSVIRFITAGSVDDGKSTLIGRLLFDSQSLLADQIATLYHQGKHKRTTTDQPDFARLIDGLAAEQEQGITIDVAYRYFATPKRKFIIADTPGHEQYTRNMVTGASTAHAAIILIDATRLDFNAPQLTLLPQTHRHSALLKLLGIRHIIVAVNKLDLLDYQQQYFEQIKNAYSQLAMTLDLPEVRYIPISALNGDNIVQPSSNMPWYQDQSLLTILEELPIDQPSHLREQTAIMPIQRVVRQDGSAANDFRGYQGYLEQGILRSGDAVRIEPAGYQTQIQTLYSPDKAIDTAYTGSVLTVVLNDDIDVSRGDYLVAADSTIQPTRQLTAQLCWFDNQPLNLARRYWLKHTTQTIYSKIRHIDYLWDIHNFSQQQQVDTLKLNDIGQVQISLQQPIIATPYQHNTAMGAFILIDEATNHTVAAGMITQTY